VKYMNRFAVLFPFAITVFGLPIVFSRNVFLGLTSIETDVLDLVSGVEAYSYGVQLENIALSHPAFRSAGSAGADEAADWIVNQFQSFGLEVEKEEFQFTSWDLLGRPRLVIDDDGNLATIEDQSTIERFQSAHYSLPGDMFADLVVLPLPAASSRDEIGANPIDTTIWEGIDTTGKVLLIGREVRWDRGWEEAYTNKLTVQTPEAVIYTWWYDWMSFVPDFFSSAGGRPISSFGCYYWDLGIPVGFVSYDDGLWIRGRESSLDVYAKVVIDSVVDVGPHYNVVGKLTGYGHPDRFVIVSGHYDSVMCAGFGDNGAGTSGVIELARVFTEAVSEGFYYPTFTTLFVAFASEEIGLVGAINYVMQHEAQMEDIVAVINLDCIGSDNFQATKTNPTDGFDLDQLVLEAASDLGIDAGLEEFGGDEGAFKDPVWSNEFYLRTWGLTAGIDDATPVESSTMLISSPTVYSDKWSVGMPGWIHTSYDNSTSTETLNWVEADDLEGHIKVAALTVMRVSPPVLVGDLNNDGIVDIFDVVTVSMAFGSTPLDSSWNIAADLNNDDVVDIFDVVLLAQNFGKTV